jgi:tellurium resistance protein TerZ
MEQSARRDVEGSRRKSRKLDLRQNLVRIPASMTIDLGLQWSFVARGAHGECLDVIFYNNLTCRSEAGEYMKHSGDNTTGEDIGDQDDEVLHFCFAKIPEEVSYLMVCVTSYTGADFTLVESASCKIRNTATGEQVGEFQLGLIGAHTATLLCCISRVAPTATDPNSYWDLRELGLPGTGFTFVEVIPMMQELINVPAAEREAKQRLLPDFSLVKDPSLKSRDVIPSVMKFAIGWDGDNDLDCFLVMLDANDEYIDHVYAKTGKLKSREGAALHSGDKLNGFAGDGDDEFIDLDVNKLSKEIHRVFFVVSLYSGFALNLGDVPNCYCRIQNRAPTEMFVEVDRSNISKSGSTNFSLIFAAIVRKDAVRFEYCRLHDVTSGRDYIQLLPWIRFASRFLSESLKTQQAALQPLSHSLLGHQHHHGAAASAANSLPEEVRLQHYWDSGWEAQNAPVAGKLFGVELRFIEVTDLGPLEPHQFACHVESWVCDRKCSDKAKTSICSDRNRIAWPEDDRKSLAKFAVHPYDRVRILVYEHSVAGFADLEIGTISDVFRGKDVDLTLPLKGKQATGNIRFTVRHIPLKFVPGHEDLPLYHHVCSVM